MPSAWRGVKPDFDLIDADTGEVVARGRQEDHRPRSAKKLADKGLKTLRARRRGPASASYLAEDIVNSETGEIYAEAGDELDEKLIEAARRRQASTRSPVLDIDHVTVGAYIRNTLRVDKNASPRGRAVRHLPRDASGRAADAREPPRRCSSRCSSTASATTCRPSAA